MPHKKSLWRKAIQLERESGTKESLSKLLGKAIENEESQHEFLFIEYSRLLL